MEEEVKMYRRIIPAVLVLMLATLACSINVNVPKVDGKMISTQTFDVNVPLPTGSAVNTVAIEMGAGNLDIAPGASGLMEGSVKYNLDTWKPTLLNQNGDVSLKQGRTGGINLPTDVVNDWNLKLSTSALMDLSVTAGAYQGSLDLSGLRLQNLHITDGASQADVKFDELNPVTMHTLSYKTGASQVKLTGLANANFESMTFDSGAGDYTLDFSGKLQRNANVSVKSGVSSITIIIPSGMSCQIHNAGAVSGIDTQGTWTTNGNDYSTTGSGPTLTIDISMGVGGLKLVAQ
jgi:hypothetical protein